MTRCLCFVSYFSSQAFARMMKSAEVMNSATMPEASACPAVRAESAAHGIPCVVQEIAAVMVSRGISFEIYTNIFMLVTLLLPIGTCLSCSHTVLFVFSFTNKTVRSPKKPKYNSPLSFDISRCLSAKWHWWHRCTHHHWLALTQWQHGASYQKAPLYSWPPASCCERWVCWMKEWSVIIWLQ